MSFRSGGDGGGRGMSRGNFSAPRGNFQTGGESRGNFSARAASSKLAARCEQEHPVRRRFRAARGLAKL